MKTPKENRPARSSPRPCSGLMARLKDPKRWARFISMNVSMGICWWLKNGCGLSTSQVVIVWVAMVGIYSLSAYENS